MNLSATLRLHNRGFNNPLADSQRMLGVFRYGLLNIIGPLAGVSAGVIAVAGAVRELRSSLDEAADLQSLEVAMEVLTGDAAVAKKLIAELVDFAATTPFELKDLAPASKQLLAFGVGAEQNVGILRRLGDVASALNIPLSEIVEVYGRNLVQGRLFARDIYQFQMRGIPIIKELAKQFGVTEDRVMDLVTAGKVTSVEMEKAFITMTDSGGMFFGMMERQSEIWKGKMSTLRDTWAAVKRSFGGPLIEGLLPSLDGGIARLDALIPRARALGEDIAQVLRAVRGASAEGRLGEVLGTSLRLGFALALNFLSAGLVAAATGFSQALSLGATNLDAIEDVLTGAAAQFGAALLNAVNRPLAYIQAFFEQLAATPWLAMAMGTSPGAMTSFSAQAGARAQRIMGEGGPTFGFGGDGMNAADIAAAARAKMEQGIAALVEPLSQGIIDIFKRTRERGIEDISGAGGIRESLKTLIQELGGQVAGAKEAANAALNRSGSVGSNGAAGAGPDIQPISGDRLARIGGFIGGAGGPAVDYARRTAAATEKIADKIVQALNMNPPQPSSPYFGAYA